MPYLDNVTIVSITFYQSFLLSEYIDQVNSPIYVSFKDVSSGRRLINWSQSYSGSLFRWENALFLCAIASSRVGIGLLSVWDGKVAESNPRFDPPIWSLLGKKWRKITTQRNLRVSWIVIYDIQCTAVCTTVFFWWRHHKSSCSSVG